MRRGKRTATERATQARHNPSEMGRQVIGKMRSMCTRSDGSDGTVPRERAHSHALVMSFRNQEGVTGANRVDVKEGDTAVILVDLRSQEPEVSKELMGTFSGQRSGERGAPFLRVPRGRRWRKRCSRRPCLQRAPSALLALAKKSLLTSGRVGHPTTTTKSETAAVGC